MTKPISPFFFLFLISIMFLTSLHANIAVQAINTNTNRSVVDSDQDGIPDSRDKCPQIPGNLKNATNVNGCPSIGSQSFSNITPGIFAQAPTCTMCPCPTLDYQADLRIGDIIFAILSDLTHQTIYTKSNLYYIAE
jgi:hypothetical protein